MSFASCQILCHSKPLDKQRFPAVFWNPYKRNEWRYGHEVRQKSLFITGFRMTNNSAYISILISPPHPCYLTSLAVFCQKLPPTIMVDEFHVFFIYPILNCQQGYRGSNSCPYFAFRYPPPAWKTAKVAPTFFLEYKEKKNLNFQFARFLLNSNINRIFLTFQ